MSRRVRTAVFPVAGLGTRFLPATKAMPKEMLPVVDRPLIQYAVEEAREAGIEHFVFVTGRNKGVIEDHFDRQFELEVTLAERGKTDALAELRKDLPRPGQSSFTRQQEPLGLGHAVWCARDLVGREPFALLLPDMLFKSSPGVLAQMMAAYDERGGNIIAVEEVAPSEVSSYGVVGRGEGPDTGFEITSMVEKPAPGAAPSNLIISGRYILQPEIFNILGGQTAGTGGEIQITDAMQTLMQDDAFTGVKYTGRSFDCGSKIGFLTANVVFALDRPDIASHFLREIRMLTDELPIGK
ncbi:MAG TPA: UTP--glucose-1-phosphate uridylyltransferase GalU [Devosiaceae bacterium]